jgi:hypothetical protein
MTRTQGAAHAHALPLALPIAPAGLPIAPALAVTHKLLRLAHARLWVRDRKWRVGPVRNGGMMSVPGVLGRGVSVGKASEGEGKKK